MDANQLVLRRGLADTRATLEEWNANPWGVLREWLLWSGAIAAALLLSVWVIAEASQPDPTPLIVPGLTRNATFADAQHVLIRNLLVLALHSLACLAGFMAGSAAPHQAELRTGLSRVIHEKAGPLAIAFVVCATLFSLVTQAYVLGSDASTIANQQRMSPAELLVGILPHAVPELVALFLPLAAWTIASRRDEWHKLLAATVATTALALPVLMTSSVIEVYLSPHLVAALAG
jgi:Stage II sporulation protein M